ncbi:putative signal peptide protein [Puccinia sorghi]|uniref:Putative signal peptide protein n=1 Tax=Puccinia sorghi TaxID=27349 RepID=A0A0L6UYS2_9BASI|nr:putative signal peptide protein [Puccinia sorghi]
MCIKLSIAKTLILTGLLEYKHMSTQHQPTKYGTQLTHAYILHIYLICCGYQIYKQHKNGCSQMRRKCGVSQNFNSQTDHVTVGNGSDKTWPIVQVGIVLACNFSSWTMVQAEERHPEEWWVGLEQARNESGLTILPPIQHTFRVLKILDDFSTFKLPPTWGNDGQKVIHSVCKLINTNYHFHFLTILSTPDPSVRLASLQVKTHLGCHFVTTPDQIRWWRDQSLSSGPGRETLSIPWNYVKWEKFMFLDAGVIASGVRSQRDFRKRIKLLWVFVLYKNRVKGADFNRAHGQSTDIGGTLLLLIHNFVFGVRWPVFMSVVITPFENCGAPSTCERSRCPESDLWSSRGVAFPLFILLPDPMGARQPKLKEPREVRKTSYPSHPDHRYLLMIFHYLNLIRCATGNLSGGKQPSMSVRSYHKHPWRSLTIETKLCAVCRLSQELSWVWHPPPNLKIFPLWRQLTSKLVGPTGGSNTKNPSNRNCKKHLKNTQMPVNKNSNSFGRIRSKVSRLQFRFTSRETWKRT